MYYHHGASGASIAVPPEALPTALQAVDDFRGPLAFKHLYQASSMLPGRQRGTWFDEGYDLREPEGTIFTLAVLEAIAAVDTRQRKRSEGDRRNHEMLIRKLIANAVRCENYHAPATVAVQLRASAYAGKPTWLSGKAMSRATRLLSDAGLIVRVKGHHGIAATTFTASPALLTAALEAGVAEQSLIYHMPGDRTVRLRIGNRETELLDFRPNSMTQAWAALLDDYNNFIAGQDIDLSISSEEVVTLTDRINSNRSQNKIPYKRPELIRKCLYRQFNNGSFLDGGRLYGAWWQNCPTELRKRIAINGSPTIELDFAGCLIRMLYHLKNIDYQDDPYLLDPLTECEATHQLGDNHFREPVKLMMQALINGRDGNRNELIRMPKEQTFRPYFSRLDIVNMLTEKHKPIAAAFYSGSGIRLQRHESDIALDIITKLKSVGIACLPVHDSFIVSIEHQSVLRDTMNDVYRQNIGYTPIIK